MKGLLDMFFSHFEHVIDVHFPKINGRICGFAFVRFLHFEAIQKALKRGEKLELNERMLFVAEARRRSGKGFVMHNGVQELRGNQGLLRAPTVGNRVRTKRFYLVRLMGLGVHARM